MTYALASIALPLIVADPLAGIAVGGSAGVVAVLLCAALVGAALNALARRSGPPPDHDRHGISAADHEIRHAA